MDALPLRGDELAVEIGPGRGAMTRLLVERARKVVAIELDRALAQKLQDEFAGNARLEIITSDVLEVDFTALCRKEGVEKALVFGNLPYYITSPILQHLFAHRQAIRAMGLLMQREVAERLVAAPGSRDYGYLTVATQLYTQPEIALDVPAGAFSPPPKVRSSLVLFRMAGKTGDWPQTTCEEFLEFVKRCFAQKRKNLLNNLVGIYARQDALEALEIAGTGASARAEELSIEQLASIFASLGGARGSAP